MSEALGSSNIESVLTENRTRYLVKDERSDNCAIARIRPFISFVGIQNPGSAIRNPRSEIRNPGSEIRNPKIFAGLPHMGRKRAGTAERILDCWG